MKFATEERFDAFLAEHPGQAFWVFWHGEGDTWELPPEGLRSEPWGSMMHAKGWTLVTNPGVVVGRHPWGYTRIRSRTRAAIARIYVGEKTP